MKIRKNIVLLSVTIVTLISLVALATYSYFTASVNTNNKITTNVKMPLRPTFAVNGGGEMALFVDRKFTLQENVYNGTHIEDVNTKSVSKNLTVTLTGEPGTTCTYNLYYKDINGNYNPVGAGGSWELYFVLHKNNNEIISNEYYYLSSRTATSKTTALFESTAPFTKAKPVLIIPSGSTSATDTWQFFLRFINRDWDQSALAGKTFKGELYIDDVSCT